MSTINVDIVSPETGTKVTVSGVTIDSPNTDCIAVGTDSLASITTGLRNIAIGTEALNSVTSGNNSVAIGYNALKLYNGFPANVAIGFNSLINLVSGIQNTAIGSQSLEHATGTGNTAVGFQSLVTQIAGTNNSALGNQAGIGLVSGNQNTFLGNQSGYLSTSGNNNIIIGYLAGASTPTSSNEITLGNSSNTVLRCAVTSITSLSDARDKKEIVELPVGLEFIKSLKPVSFVWDDRTEDGKHDIKDFGFIAQDLKATQEKYDMAETLGLVYEENPEKLEASYGKLIPILVKAIQELTAKVEQLKK